jgi:hypothetical protein
MESSDSTTTTESRPQTVGELWTLFLELKDKVDKHNVDIAALMTEGPDVHSRQLEAHDERLTEIERERIEMRSDIRSTAADVRRVVEYTTASRLQWGSFDRKLEVIVRHLAPKSEPPQKRSPFDGP